MPDDPTPFAPDSCETLLSEDGKRVLVRFNRDSGERLEVEFPRNQLPFFAKQIVACIEPGQATPIDAGSLRPGTLHSLVGHQVRKDSRGQLVLTLFITLHDGGQDRGVTIPIGLNPKEAEDLIQMLSQ